LECFCLRPSADRKHWISEGLSEPFVGRASFLRDESASAPQPNLGQTPVSSKTRDALMDMAVVVVMPRHHPSWKTHRSASAPLYLSDLPATFSHCDRSEPVRVLKRITHWGSPGLISAGGGLERGWLAIRPVISVRKEAIRARSLLSSSQAHRSMSQGSAGRFSCSRRRSKRHGIPQRFKAQLLSNTIPCMSIDFMRESRQ